MNMEKPMEVVEGDRSIYGIFRLGRYDLKMDIR